MTEPTYTEQIAEIEREIRIRDRVYARWILSGKLTATAAASQTARLRAVMETLKRAMVELSPQEPGRLATGEAFGPARAREVERAEVLAAVAKIVDDHAMYRIVAELQAMDAGKTNRRM